MDEFASRLRIFIAQFNETNHTQFAISKFEMDQDYEFDLFVTMTEDDLRHLTHLDTAVEQIFDGRVHLVYKLVRTPRRITL